MADKTGTAGALKRVSARPKKNSGEVKASLKVSSQTPLTSIKTRDLFTSKEHLGDGLRDIVDKKWEDCWPVSNLRPLALLDLICYLLFIKLLEDKGLITATPNLKINTTRYKPEEHLCWSAFKDFDGPALLQLFTIEKGIPDLIDNYGRTNLQFSKNVREPLLLRPTARLLTNVIDIIKIMDAQSDATRALLFEHLISKVEIEAQNGQVYAPDNVIKLVVEMLQPKTADLVWDPCAGNGSFLANCAMHMKLNNSQGLIDFNEDFYAGRCTGVETDPIQLRIGAMNMILHSIENPSIDHQNILESPDKFESRKASLILSNLFFDDASAKTQIVANKSQAPSKRPEIQFLNLIVKHIKKGARAGIIIPEYILYNNAPDIKAIRQCIMEEHKLEAVISLPHSAVKVFSGACILIIDDTKYGSNDQVWFYKMNASVNNIFPGDISLNENLETLDDQDSIRELLTRWKNKEQEANKARTENSFFVSAEEITDNNYNLCFNEYRKVAVRQQVSAVTESPVVPEKESLGLFVSKVKFTTDLLQTKFYLIKEKVNALKTKIHLPKINIAASRKKINLNKLNFDLPRINFSQVTTLFHPIKTKINLSKSNIELPGIKTQLRGIKFKLPQIKTGKYLQLFNKKRAQLVTASIFVVLIAMACFSIFFRNKNTLPVNISLKNNSLDKVGPVGIKTTPGVRIEEPSLLSRQQIKAILYDTTGINHFKSEPDNELPLQKDSVNKLSNDGDNDIQNNFENTANDGVLLPKKNLQVKYKVVDTTFFHDEPVTRSRRKTFLDPLKNNVLNSLHDKNGFIYIVYTNALGRTSKGWINKKDLKPLQ